MVGRFFMKGVKSRGGERQREREGEGSGVEGIRVFDWGE